MKAKHIYDLNYVKEQKKRWIVDYTTRDIATIQKGTVAYEGDYNFGSVTLEYYTDKKWSIRDIDF